MSKPIEIFRFLKLPPDGKRAMRIRGELVSDVSDIADERVQKVIRRSIAELVKMAGGIDVLIEEGLLEAPAPPPQPPAESAPHIIDPTQITELKEAEQASTKQEATDPLQRSSENEAAFLRSIQDNQVEQPKTADNSLLGRFRTLSGRQPTQPESKPSLDIASQINTMLQARVTKMPTRVGRQIELRSNLGGELLFMVDGRPYESMAEIPDEEAVGLFRAAISDWENR